MKDPRRNKEWLEKAYQTKSIQEIADELGLSYATIHRDFVKFKIKIRNRKEWMKLRPNTYTDVLKSNWAKDSYREKMTQSFKQRWENSEYREKMIRIAQEKWDSEEYREKMDQVYQSKEYKEKQRQNSKELWENEEFREKMAVHRANYPVVSSYAKIFYSILDDLGIKYYREYNDRPNDPETIIGPYNFDCVIPRKKQSDLLIEIQGPPHEIFENRICNDARKQSYIINNFSGQYELKHIWYHEFGCKNKIIEIIKYWTGHQQEFVDYSFSDLEISKIEGRTEVKRLLGNYHYLPNPGRGGIIYGAHFKDELIAVCVFSTMVRQNIAQRFNLKNDQMRELSRFCIHPNYQKKNLGSWFLSRCLKQFKKDYPKYQKVISYADATYNHNGALYKATNFKLDGEIKPDYWYQSEDGWVMHKKTLYNKALEAKMVEKEFAKEKGYQKVWGKKKLRFIYDL